MSRKHSRGFDSEQSSVGQILSSPFRFIWGFLYFMVMSWTTSRSGRAFVMAIPAMTAILGVIGASWLVGLKGFQHAVENSNAGRNYHAQFSPDNPEYSEGYAWKNFGLVYDIEKPLENRSSLYELGVALYRNDKKDEATRIMQMLAPDDEFGFPRAHIWQADFYRSPEVSGLDEQEGHKKSKKHFKFAIEADPNNLVARNGLAQVTARESTWAETPEKEIEKLQEALKRYAEIAFVGEVTNPQIQLAAVIRYLSLLEELEKKDPSNAEEYQQRAKKRAEKTLTTYEIIAYRQAPDYVLLWATLVRCAVNLGDFDRANKLVSDAVQLATRQDTRQNIQALSSQILLEKSETFTDMSNEEEFRGKLFALSESIISQFRNNTPYKELIPLFDKESVSSDQEIWIRDAISRNKDVRVAGIIHILLGIREIDAENYSEGEKHWEIANQQFQFSQYVINIMIRNYAAEKELAYEKKLEFLTVALELFPQQAAFFYTRGNYHKEAKNYQLAIDDLEYAAKRFSKVVDLFESLSECYQELGNSSKASEHDRTVETLLAEIEAARRRARNLPPIIEKEATEDEESDEKESAS